MLANSLSSFLGHGIVRSTWCSFRSYCRSVGAPILLQYDLKEHKVLRTIPWPKNEEREFANIRMSPDGKLLYFFSEDVLIYDTAEFKQVDKWELSRPIEEGFGRINFGSMDDINEEPGFFTGV